MKRLYAPWRSNYIKEERDQHKAIKLCPFCLQFEENNDQKNFILKRYDHTAVMLNLYPYNAGHIMVLPYEHTAHLAELSEPAKIELMKILTMSIEILKKTLKADGINVGLNLGKAAGGSISEHIHIHVIPRWFGDTNFLMAIADTKQIPFDMHEMYKILRETFS